MVSYLFSYHIILLFLRYFRFSDLVPLDLICFHVKFEAASVAFVYNGVLRLVGVVYDTIFAVLYIGMDFYIVSLWNTSSSALPLRMRTRGLHGRGHGCS